MRRKKEISYIRVRLPVLLRDNLDATLWSESQERIPHGAYTEYFSQLVREDLTWQRLDLGPYGFPPGYFIKGPMEMIEALRITLSREVSDGK